MKQFKFSIAWLAMFALVFTSCSKDEADAPIEDQELVEITFGSLMNDFQNQTKQSDPGECNDGTPDYVLVGITEGANANSTNYVDDGDPGDGDDLIEVGLKWNSSLGIYETEYSDLLALPAGDYHLQSFVVYDTEGSVLWVAPRIDGAYGTSVGDPLPHLLDLEAGTKPYINVDVLCYIPRNEEAYGYLFFDLNLVRVSNNYCIFVDFCWDETGRDYPAHFSVEVWSDGYDGTPVIVNNDINTVDTSGDWPAASVLCFALPTIGDDDLYYIRVTLLDYDGAYELDDDRDYIVEFTISQDEIDAQEAMDEGAYEHIRYNCEPGYEDPCTPGDSNIPGDHNNDCVVDCRDTNTCPDDPCPGIDPALDTNGDCVIDCRDTNTCDSQGCGDTAFMFGDYILSEHYNGQNWGWGLLVDGIDVDAEFYDEENDRWVLPFWAGAGQNDTSRAWRAGDVILEIDGDQLHVTIDLYDDVTVGDTHFWFNDQGEWPENRAPGQFDLHPDSDELSYSFTIGPDATDLALIVHAGDTCHEEFD